MNSSTDGDFSQRRTFAYLSLLLVGAAAVRWLSGVDWGFPYGFHSDELRYLTRIVEDPSVAIWTIYGRWPIYFQRIVSWISGRPRTDLLLARQLSVCVSIAGIAAVGLTAKRLSGWLGALVATALLCGAPAVVQAAHFFITDVWLWSALAWSVYFCCSLVDRGGWSQVVAIGATWGLAVGSKSSGLFLFPAICFAYGRAPSGHRWLKLLVTCLVAGSLALAGQPTLLVHGPEAFFMRGQFLHHLGVAAGTYLPSYTLQFENTPAWTYYLTHLLWWGAGPVLTISGSAALYGLTIWSVQKCRRGTGDGDFNCWVLIAVVFLSFYATSAGQRDKYSRYILPLLPSLAMLGGRVLSAGIVRARGMWRPIAIGLVIIAGSLPGLMYAGIYDRLDTRLQAAAWMIEYVPIGSTICHEPDLGFAVPPIGMGGPAYRDAGARNYQGVLLDLGLLYNASTFLRENQSAAVVMLPEYEGLSTQDQQRLKIQEWLSTCDWVVLSDRFADQYLPLTMDFEAISDFYREMLSAQHPDWQLVASFRSLPGILGFETDDRESELTFRSFDHPSFWVFERR